MADLAAILAANSRLPDMVLGDLYAQAACLEVAERRLLEMCARFGADRGHHGHAGHAGPQRAAGPAGAGPDPARRVRGRGPHRRGRAGQRPVPGPGPGGDLGRRRGVRLHRQPPAGARADQLHLERAGVRGPHRVQGHHRPGRAGHRRLVPAADHRLPAGDDLQRATRPAPVAAYFEATEMASDLVWRAVAPAFPALTAGSFVSVCSTSLALTHPDTGQPTLLVEPQPGGWGASATQDGEHGLVSVGDGETYVIPVEIAEQRYGIRVERFGLDVGARRRGGPAARRPRPGPGVPGRLSDEALLTVAWGRHLFPPWGAAGGRDGSPNYVQVVRPPTRPGRTADRQGLPAAAAPRGPGPAGDRHRRGIRRPARARARAGAGRPARRAHHRGRRGEVYGIGPGRGRD